MAGRTEKVQRNWNARGMSGGGGEEESEENVDAAVTEEVEEEKPVKKKAKLQIKATDYVSKYEELADAKNQLYNLDKVYIKNL